MSELINIFQTTKSMIKHEHYTLQCLIVYVTIDKYQTVPKQMETFQNELRNSYSDVQWCWPIKQDTHLLNQGIQHKSVSPHSKQC